MQDERFNSEQLGSDSSKIHVKKFILPVALIAVGIFDSSKAALPVGVTFDMRKGIRISAANARLLNDQVAAVDRDKHIEEYTTLLQSDQIADRCWAATALGRFQSEASLRALLARIHVETEGPVLDELYNQLNTWFGIYGYPTAPPAFGISREHALAGDKLWEAEYLRFGYVGLAKHGWDVALSSGRASIEGFLKGLEARFDIALVPFLVNAFDSLRQPDFREEVATIILCWSGYDLRAQNVDQVKRELVSPNALSPSNICERYRAYFRRIGLASPNSSTPDILDALSKAPKDQTSHYLPQMARRMKSCN